MDGYAIEGGEPTCETGGANDPAPRADPSTQPHAIAAFANVTPSISRLAKQLKGGALVGRYGASSRSYSTTGPETSGSRRRPCLFRARPCGRSRPLRPSVGHPGRGVGLFTVVKSRPRACNVSLSKLCDGRHVAGASAGLACIRAFAPAVAPCLCCWRHEPQ